MNLKSIFGLGKKKTKNVSTKRKATDKPVKRKKPATRTAEVVREDPLISVSRQLTRIQEEVEGLDTMTRSGFQGLREDHHKILEDQFSKNDLDEFKKELVGRKLDLEKLKGKIEEKIELLDIDKKVLDVLEEGRMKSAEIANKLGIVRQYAAARLSKLEKLGYVKKIKKGRNVYYKLKND